MSTWVKDSAAPLPQHVFGAERVGIRGTPALTAWIVEHAPVHDLSLLPYDDAGPFVRRFHVAGQSGYMYQLGGRAVFVDPEGNRLFV